MTGVLFPGETTDFVGGSRGFANFDEKRADEFWLLCCITYKLAPEKGSDPGIDAHIFIVIRDGEQFRPLAHRLTNNGILAQNDVMPGRLAPCPKADDLGGVASLIRVYSKLMNSGAPVWTKERGARGPL